MTATRRRYVLGVSLVVLAAALLVPTLLRDNEPKTLDVETLSIGDSVSALYTLTDQDELERIEVGAGEVSVVWFWSVLCACVGDCEQRIRTLLERYEGKQVRFVAIDSNPNDAREDIERLRKKLGSRYPVRRDYHGATAISLGITASASVAVIDGEGRLRFRGAIDDDLYEPTVSYVHRAIDGILSGATFEPTEAKPYGCLYPYSPQ